MDNNIEIQLANNTAVLIARRELADGIYNLDFINNKYLDALPGQFIEIQAGPSVLLRRPISLSFVDKNNKTRFSIIIRVVGEGTHWISSLRNGSKIDFIGPLGKQRNIMQPKIKSTNSLLLLVGGGIGVPPLLYFYYYYGHLYSKSNFLIGSGTRTEANAYNTILRSIRIDKNFDIRKTIDNHFDITYNYPDYIKKLYNHNETKGLVTELLCNNDDINNYTNITVVACGPKQMLYECYKYCNENNIDCWVLVEALMGCGTGLCRGCAVPAADGGYKMVCEDGPLFRAEELAWPLPSTPHSVSLQQVQPAPADVLRVALGPLELPTPVVTASGTCGNGGELYQLNGLDGVGALTTKTVTLEPRPGNPPPRVCETPAGLLNSIGLANVGLEAFLERELPRTLELVQQARSAPAERPLVIVNIGGSTIDDYVEAARRLDAFSTAHHGPAALELNVSCPNVRRGGLQFGTDPAVLAELVGRVRRVVDNLPLFVKLTPNVTDIVPPARAAVESGADGLTAANTLLGLRIDPATSRPLLGNGLGGLSGPAVRPVAVRLVHQLRRALPRIPLVGLGGVEDWSGAAEHLIAGADAVGVGTASFYRPDTPRRICDGLRRLLQQRNMRKLNELRGSLRMPQD